jgi:dihydroxyacetone kinase-like predicted kinase
MIKNTADCVRILKENGLLKEADPCDAEISGVRIKNGDTIGIIGKEIVISKKDRKKAVLGLLEKLVENPPKYMLTVFFGKNSTEKERADLTSAIAEKYPSLEAYFIDGGQEIAPYIFVAE